jgi:RHS repeat-associated protein
MEIVANGSTVTTTRFYPGGAMRQTGQPVKWVITDHQGSTVAVVTANGTSTASVTRPQEPYGARRTTTVLPTERGFLGKPEDPTGLVATDNRYYDPAIGRFISPDPLLVPTDPQSLNGYTYSGNNPVTLMDPSGLRPIGQCDGPCPPKEPTGGDYGSPDAAEASRSNPPPRATQHFDKTRYGNPWLLGSDFLSDGLGGGPAGGCIRMPDGPCVLVPKFGTDTGTGTDTRGRTGRGLTDDEKQLLKLAAMKAASELLRRFSDSGFYRGSRPPEPVSFVPQPYEYRIDSVTGFVKDTHGVSVFDNPYSVASKG